METLKAGQILYYVDWKKHPTIHECKIAKISENQKDVHISINLDICKAFSGGSFQSPYELGRKYFISEKAARDQVQDYYVNLIKVSLDAHNKLLNKWIKSASLPIKPL